MAVKDYKVLTSIITVRLEKDSKKVYRVLRGNVLALDDEIVDVAELLRLKAIGVAGTKGLKPTNAATLAAAAGAEDDPVKVPEPAAAGVAPQNDGSVPAPAATA